MPASACSVSCPDKPATLETSEAEGQLSPTALLQGFAKSTVLFQGQHGKETLSEPNPGWQLAASPFALSAGQLRELEQLGEDLLAFNLALLRLYEASRLGQALDGNVDGQPVPGWVASLLNAGKPDSLLAFAAQHFATSGTLPLVIRPDLLLTEEGFALCEIDAVPGGLGFTAALNAAYKASGFSVLEAPEASIPEAFYRMLSAYVRKHLPEPLLSAAQAPRIAIILSEEAADYRHELQWLTDALQAARHPVVLLAPEALNLQTDAQGHERLVYQDAHSGAWLAIDGLYRFYELFDLPNIGTNGLIEKAIAAKTVVCTPPYQPVFEEKLWLALLHHPALSALWERALGEAAFKRLQGIVPESWLLLPDSTSLGPEALYSRPIEGLFAQKQPVQQFSDLGKASQKERQLVVKPSGFSPLSWGSRGVSIGHDLPATVWSERINQALAQADSSPYLLQRFHKPKTVSIDRLDTESGAITPFEGRVRLCPYYFVNEGKAVLSGALATICPKDKKIIHGMRSAIMAPCQLKS